jgi:hypothetical protein
MVTKLNSVCQDFCQNLSLSNRRSPNILSGDKMVGLDWQMSRKLRYIPSMSRLGDQKGGHQTFKDGRPYG